MSVDDEHGRIYLHVFWRRIRFAKLTGCFIFLLHTQIGCTHSHKFTLTKTHLIHQLIKLLLPRRGFHTWGPNSLHLIGPLRKSLSCSHLQGYIHTHVHTHNAYTHMRSLRANQYSAPWAMCTVPSIPLSIFYPLVHPLLSAPSVPLPQRGTPIPGTEPQLTDRHTRTHTHTQDLIVRSENASSKLTFIMWALFLR